jgi:hypothetical protein
VNIGRKGMMFGNESDEGAKRVEGVQRVRDNIEWISLEGVVHRFEVFLDFLTSLDINEETIYRDSSTM